MSFSLQKVNEPSSASESLRNVDLSSPRSEFHCTFSISLTRPPWPLSAVPYNPLTHDLDHGLVIPIRLRSSVAEPKLMAVPWTVAMELPSTH